MALARARRNETGFNYWPGFVDALSTLVLSIVFLLSVFLVVQFFLSQEVTGKDKALEQLNAKIAQLNDLLSLEKLTGLTLNDQLSQMRAGLASAEADRDRVKGLYEGLAGAGSDAAGRATELNKALDSEKQLSARALAQIEVLNQQISALRRQLAALEEALDASEKRDKESQGKIVDLGQRLNVALAQRVQELSRYRSEFFGRLRAILGNRPDIRIVGDRFVFQSEVFFDTGQALLLPEGRAELEKLAAALTELDKQIPAEIAWVLRVDGHTDVRPILNSPVFKSNCGAIPDLARRAGAAPGRRRLCRIPAARHRRHRRSLQAQPPHRAEADGTVSDCGVSASPLRGRGRGQCDHAVA
jgi:chemotaxis protein MotB